MIKKILILGIACLFVLPLCNGQQEINYTMFMFNKLAINPAYAGSAGALRISGHYRNQWTGFKGAPKNFTLSAHSQLFSERMGGGITVTSDHVGVVKEHLVDLAYAYRIPFDHQKSTLSIGLSGILQYRRIKWNETNPLHTEDPELPDAPSSRTNPNFGLGAYYQASNFYAGVSIPRLFQTTFYNYTKLGDYSLSASRSIFIMGGYVKELSRTLKFQPGVLMTVNGNTPFDMDLNASLIFMDKIWVGLSYRLEDSVNAIFQIQFTDQIKGAAAIDFTLSELNSYAPASFELMVQYTMIRSTNSVDNIRFF